jgi:molecular chaperone DnaK (HSP70)
MQPIELFTMNIPLPDSPLLLPKVFSTAADNQTQVGIKVFQV